MTTAPITSITDDILAGIEAEFRACHASHRDITIEPDQAVALVERLREAELDAATERMIQRAAELLPDGYQIEIAVEKDAGSVSLFCPGGLVECDFHGSIAEQISEAIDTAMQEPPCQ